MDSDRALKKCYINKDVAPVCINQEKIGGNRDPTRLRRESVTGGRLALLPAVREIKARRVLQTGRKAGYQRSKVEL